jgi:glycosyltransferase involved in cell wall biosynthesis
MSVSVVIPALNRSRLLHRALLSVSEQRIRPVEVLIIDDGSHPPLNPSHYSQYPNLKFFRNEVTEGVASSRNKGIKQAQGNWIALLDSDDEWDSSKLEKQLELTKTSDGIRAIHTDEKWIRNGNEVLPPRYLDKSNHLLWERSLRHCLICPSSVLLHKSVFDEIGFFDESLTVCEDYDFWLRLLLEEKIELIEEKLVIKHGGHPDQLSTTTWGMDRFRIKSLQKLTDSTKLSPQQKTLVIEVITEKCAILAKGSEKRQKSEEAKNFRELANKYNNRLTSLGEVL